MSDYNYNDMVFNGVDNVPNHFILDGFEFTLKSDYNECSKIMLFKVKKLNPANTKNFIDLLCQKVRMTVEMIYRVYIVSTVHWTTTKYGTDEQTFFLSYGILFTDDVLKGPKFSMEYSVGLIANNSYGISIPDNKFMSEIHKFDNPALNGYDRVMYSTHIFFIQMDKRLSTDLDYKMNFINDTICTFIDNEINHMVYSELTSGGVNKINFIHHLIEDDYNLIIISEISGYNDITIEALSLNSVTIEIGENGLLKADNYFDYFFTGMTSSQYELNTVYKATVLSNKTMISTEGSKYLVDANLDIVRLIINHPLSGHKNHNDEIRKIQYIPINPKITVIDYKTNIPNFGVLEDRFVKDLFFKFDSYVIADSDIININALSVISVKKDHSEECKQHLVYQIPEGSQINRINLQNIPYIITIIDKDEFDYVLKLLRESKYEFNFNLIYKYGGYYYIGIYVECKKENDINVV